jgi:hypothetical protein
LKDYCKQWTGNALKTCRTRLSTSLAFLGRAAAAAAAATSSWSLSSNVVHPQPAPCKVVEDVESQNVEKILKL